MADMITPIETIFDDMRAGKMCIVIDDEDRENEGDLVIPAAFADAEAINFMAKHGRGLICLSLESAQVQQLGLPPMARHNSSRHQTAFTVSIEAREGVTTGISAADRAHTIAIAIASDASPATIATPGHVFPLEARAGGVLVRAGHTEAAVDLARLAGHHPSGVICEIMKDNGEMARLDDLIPFAKEHNLNIGTIADLIAYRRHHEKLVGCIAEAPFSTVHAGDFTCKIYSNTLSYAEHIVLIKGHPDFAKPVHVRMHAIDVLSDVLGDTHMGKQGELCRAMQKLDRLGSGVLVLIREPRPTAASNQLRIRNGEITSAPQPLRDYGIGAQILLDIGVRDMLLLSNAKRPVVGLEGYGLTIHGYEEI